MRIKVIGHEYLYDITSMLMLFFHGEKAEYVDKNSKNVDIVSKLTVCDNRKQSITKIKYSGKWFKAQKTVECDYDSKNLVKQTFYLACSKATDITSHWGILTGIRPLSVYSKVAKVSDSPFTEMKKHYFLADDKITLLEKIYNQQHKYLLSDPRDVSLYISIPFCPGKCSYCSFISVGATRTGELLEKYINCLIKEIEIKRELISRYALNIKSIYIGGGTPGILSEDQLQRLLHKLSELFDLESVSEFSFEIGRPETVTDEKLRILKSFNVSRLCINTQTTNDDILAAVNRKHTSMQYYEAVSMAKKHGFCNINTDLIAGLPGESYESFCKSVSDVINMGISNITIHTLAIKRAASLSDEKSNYAPVNVKVNKMLDFAYDALENNGFMPYYIYRQKNCVANGENTGFCLPGKACEYNIYMMEDVHTVLACGAGASSKIINGTKVDRVINVKYPMEYTAEFDKVLGNNLKLDSILKVNLLNG